MEEIRWMVRERERERVRREKAKEKVLIYYPREGSGGGRTK